MCFTKDGSILDLKFSDIAKWIPDDSLVILNNTKVFSSSFWKIPTGGNIELALISLHIKIPHLANQSSLAWTPNEKI